MSKPPVDIKAEFKRLKARWKDETRFLSVGTFDHPDYKAIVKLGEPVVPYLLRDLEGGQPEHWFAALRIITGANPVPDEHCGRVVLMAKDWLDWAKGKEENTDGRE